MATFGRIIKTNTLFTKLLQRSNFQKLHPLRTSYLSAQSNSSAESQNGLVLTDACIKQLKRVMQPGEHLRVVVEGGGCSGFQYKFDIEAKTNDDDKVFQRDGASVVVDEDSLEFIKGSKIDYHEELIRSAFVVADNPLAEEGCSCGASFSVKL